MLKMDISLYAILRKILGELNLQVVDHGDRVAYLYLKISQYRGLPYDQHFINMMLTCYAHDIGAYKTEKFLDLLKFDVRDTHEHCVYGYLFMKHFSPIKDKAEVLLYHHTNFDEKDNYNSPYIDDGILIHMLDRIDIFNIKHKEIDDVIWQLKNGAGKNFDPKDVEDFIAANEKYKILESIRDNTYRLDVKNFFDTPEISENLLMPIINMLAYEIDFKSEQTVVHTITTQLLARALGKEFGLTRKELKELECAACIHDLGKIKIPSSIVEKPDKLSKDEYIHMKKHVVYTEFIITDIFPHTVVQIASNHHERLDGSGYPKGLTANELSLQDRLLQIADVTSALMQRRSYKESLEKEFVIEILQKEAESGKLDSDIIKVLSEKYDEFAEYVQERSNETIERYEHMKLDYDKYLKKFSYSESESIEELELLPRLERAI